MAAWTQDENDLFEESIALFDHESPDFFENIRLMLPNKTIQDIQHHYQELERDLQMIESGLFDPLLPPMTTLKQKIPNMLDEVKDKAKSDGKWSDEERSMFLLGLAKSRNKAQSSRDATMVIPHDASGQGGSDDTAPDDQH